MCACTQTYCARVCVHTCLPRMRICMCVCLSTYVPDVFLCHQIDECLVRLVLSCIRQQRYDGLPDVKPDGLPHLVDMRLMSTDRLKQGSRTSPELSINNHLCKKMSIHFKNHTRQPYVHTLTHRRTHSYITTHRVRHLRYLLQLFDALGYSNSLIINSH